jgi:hypothetical protein
MAFRIERLHVSSFVPAENFQDIVGLQIDASGNVTGWAANISRKLGFYWPIGADPYPLVYNRADCEPRGIDGAGRVFLYCQGPTRSVIFTPGAGDPYKPLSLTTYQLSDILGAGGDSWCVGFALGHANLNGVRLGTDRVPQTLPPARDDSSSVAVAVNVHGVAAGASSFLSTSGFFGEALTDRLGRAVIWGADGRATLIPDPDDHHWSPQICRGINAHDVVVGSTSPIPPKRNPCYQPAAARDIGTTRAFVSFKNFIGHRETVALPPVQGDDRLTTIVATSINDGNQIVGNRDGIDCPGVAGLSGVRAILWKQDAWGNWKPELLESLCNLENGEILNEAHAINDTGQITGKGIDSNGIYAYRLTP